jgi:hypothetical protein
LANRIRDLHAKFKSSLALPPIPSNPDMLALISLESFKLNSFDPDNFRIEAKKPNISGTVPQRIVVEVRQNQNKTALTYWYYWDHDLYSGDHIDWEPVSLVYGNSGQLIEIYGRVHDGLVQFSPTYGNKPLVYLIGYGHTPAIRVANRETDVRFFPLNDRKDALRKNWLNLCYNRADSNGWTLVTQPPVETFNSPILDSTSWKTWGKHSVYLRI